jgi:hypothetical protein
VEPPHQRDSAKRAQSRFRPSSMNSPVENRVP